MNLQKRQMIVHFLLVVAFLTLPYIFAPKGLGQMMDVFSNPHERTNFWAYLCMLVFLYLNYYWFIPRLYFSQKYLLYVFAILLCFTLVLTMIVLADRQDFFRQPPSFSAIEHVHPNPPPSYNETPPSRLEPPNKPYFGSELRHALFLFLVGVFVSLSLRINDRLRQTEREKLNTELSFLKAQINPHFLFNTLNSIYSLAIEQSPHTADAVVRLSSLMRYVMREADTDFVALTKEINYIENYVSLQKLRLDDTVTINFTVKGIANGLQIAPLLLISFIENTFKYGVNPQEKSVIDIILSINENHLHLHTFNKKVRLFYDNEATSGIGLGNTKARLELLYPAQHELVIEETESDFKLSLFIYF